MAGVAWGPSSEEALNFAGADGCVDGWLAVWIDDAGRHAWHVAQSFADVAKRVENGLLLVDIPIGLRDAGAERACDPQARKLLRRRASSVFPAPCRGVLQCKTYAEASALNHRLCGRKLSRQSWALVPKIREVDDYLRREGRSGPVVREMHPELCFFGLRTAPETPEVDGRGLRMEMVFAPRP